MAIGRSDEALQRELVDRFLTQSIQLGTVLPNGQLDSVTERTAIHLGNLRRDAALGEVRIAEFQAQPLHAQ